MENYDDPEPGSGKAKKSRRKTYKEKEEDIDADILPEEGLHNLDGQLFYHASVLPLTDAQYKRAEEHGINLRSRKRFTLEESVQIFLNWKKFAEEANLSLHKASDYLSMKIQDKHIIQHQKEYNFWPKLCHGLPHRSGARIKRRAMDMMTSEFLKKLSWEDLAEEIRKTYYQHEPYDELTMKKALVLMEKGYDRIHTADILNISHSKGKNLAAKLRRLDRREDPTMISMFYETALYFNLRPEKLRRAVASNNEYRLNRVRKKVQIEELSFRLHISEHRCETLLKKIVGMINDEYQKHLADGKTEDEAWEAAQQVVQPRALLKKEQLYEVLEILCKNIGKYDTTQEIYKNEEVAKLIKSHGITDFQCEQPEFQYLVHRICSRLLLPLELRFFQHLRRDFPIKFKLHCLLWSYKRLEVWDKLPSKKNETRFETVLKSELSRPFVSKMTLKFLKNKRVVEWITEPRLRKHNRNAEVLSLEAGTEAFILYIYQKFGNQFKLPLKLSSLVSYTRSNSIQEILSENLDSENSEYLSMKEAKIAVEEASGKKIKVKLRNKAILAKQFESFEEVDNGGEETAIKELLEHSQNLEIINLQRIENMRKEIKDVLEKADPSKIRRKYRNREDDVGEITLSKELYRRKSAMTLASKKKEKASRKEPSSMEYIEASDSSQDEAEPEMHLTEKMHSPLEGSSYHDPENFEAMSFHNSHHLRSECSIKAVNTEKDYENHEDELHGTKESLEKHSEDLKTKHVDDLNWINENRKSRKRKRDKLEDFDGSGAPEDVYCSEVKPNKFRKKKNRNSEMPHDDVAAILYEEIKIEAEKV